MFLLFERREHTWFTAPVLENRLLICLRRDLQEANFKFGFLGSVHIETAKVPRRFSVVSDTGFL